MLLLPCFNTASGNDPKIIYDFIIITIIDATFPFGRSLLLAIYLKWLIIVFISPVYIAIFRPMFKIAPL